MHVFTQSHGPGHASGTFQGVQGAFQRITGLAIMRGGAPGAQGATDLRQQAGRFFQENRQELAVQVVAGECCRGVGCMGRRGGWQRHLTGSLAGNQTSE